MRDGNCVYGLAEIAAVTEKKIGERFASEIIKEISAEIITCVSELLLIYEISRRSRRRLINTRRINTIMRAMRMGKYDNHLRAICES